MPQTSKADFPTNSVIGRLLEHLSWAGETIRNYRGGGRGYENILTAEVIQGLGFLPRAAFLGSVIAGAHGADEAREVLISEVEEATVTFLPGPRVLKPGAGSFQKRLPVFPDSLIESPRVFCLVEAKRLHTTSFQPEQLAREFALSLLDSGRRKPLLFLILPEPPPVRVKTHGKLAIRDAIALYLETVLRKANLDSVTASEVLSRTDEVVCWTTWHDIGAAVAKGGDAFDSHDDSVNAMICRLVDSVTTAILRHAP